MTADSRTSCWIRPNSACQRATSASVRRMPAWTSVPFALALATAASATRTAASACFRSASACSTSARFCWSSASTSGTSSSARTWPFLTLSPISTARLRT